MWSLCLVRSMEITSMHSYYFLSGNFYRIIDWAVEENTSHVASFAAITKQTRRRVRRHRSLSLNVLSWASSFPLFLPTPSSHPSFPRPPLSASPLRSDVQVSSILNLHFPSNSSAPRVYFCVDFSTSLSPLLSLSWYNIYNCTKQH